MSNNEAKQKLRAALERYQQAKKNFEEEEQRRAKIGVVLCIAAIVFVFGGAIFLLLGPIGILLAIALLIWLFD